MEINQQYLDMFIEESKEHLQSCSDNLLELEKNPDDLSIVNEIFRSAHTLKGMAATMGFEDLADLTHKMENVLDAIRNEKIAVNSDLLDIVFESVDDLEAMIMDIAEGGDGKRDVSEIVAKLQAIEAGEVVSSSKAEPNNEPVTSTYLQYDEYDLTVIEQSKEQGYNVFEMTISLRPDCLLKAARVYMVFEVLEKNGEVLKTFPSVEKLEEEQFDTTFYVTYVTKEDQEEIEGKVKKVSEVEEVVVSSLNEEKIRLQKTEEMEAKKEVAVKEEPKETPETSQASPKKATSRTKASQSKTIRVSIERLDILMNLFEELVIDRGRLQSIATDVDDSELTDTVERMSRTMGDLQHIVLTMRMIPVETVFNRFPKMIRSLSRELNKKINLEIIGAQTELDRTVIDEIGDPLVHLIRNSVDHGIESPAERVANGKPEEGTVILRAYHSGNYVFIEIEDDGAGINKEKVLNKAISRGIITLEAASKLTDQQINELILQSGFSTAEVVSDISGRGVGLDVVRTTIESLGGNISIESQEGVGSIFSIQLPLTLSIISVMLVEIEKEMFAIPLSSIIETSIIKRDEILNAHNQKVIDVRGRVVPLIFLEEIFEVPRENPVDDEYLSVVIVRKGDKLAGLVVDSFIGQQEVVLKSLGNYLKNIFAISGATILGNGQVALIIDVNALMK